MTDVIVPATVLGLFLNFMDGADSVGFLGEISVDRHAMALSAPSVA